MAEDAYPGGGFGGPKEDTGLGGGGSGDYRVPDEQSGAYIDAYNKGRNLPKDVGEPADDGTYYGQHPSPTTHPVAHPAPPPPPPAPPAPVAHPIHVNTPAQNAALHKHTIPGDGGN